MAMGTAPTLSLPLEGRVTAKRSGGIPSARLCVGLPPSTAAATPSDCFAAISPSRGEKRQRA